ncbi:MAG: RAMP superfamily CRISPR-associated protein [Actinomycetota bacterium]
MIYDKYAHLSQDIESNKQSYTHFIYHELHWRDKSAADEFRNKWALSKESKKLQDIPSKAVWEAVEKPQINLNILPPCSVFIRFRFTLAKPYLSRDENLFYIIDNPVRKEKVFSRPYIVASSWKGSLRAALWQMGYNEDNEKVRRLFGNERGVELQEQLRSGRLYFYPTFFDKVSLEVINPHDRKKRVGKNPILFVCVPDKASGYFTLLYIPFDLVGKDTVEIKKQVSEDLELTCKGIEVMLTMYGFGAKTSSGFGLAQDDITEVLIKSSKKLLDPMPNKISVLAGTISELFEDDCNDQKS